MFSRLTMAVTAMIFLVWACPLVWTSGRVPQFWEAIMADEMEVPDGPEPNFSRSRCSWRQDRQGLLNACSPQIMT